MMKYEVNNVVEYINGLPDDRKYAIELLRETIKDNLPLGFEETFTYGMIGFVIPHSIYPAGYHVNSDEPMPFISIASQKNYIALYHMGIYAFPEILKWFQEEYPKHVTTKLDMGKSCIRFKKVENIPNNLIADLCTKITVEDYINKYEASMKKK